MARARLGHPLQVPERPPVGHEHTPTKITLSNEHTIPSVKRKKKRKEEKKKENLTETSQARKVKGTLHLTWSEVITPICVLKNVSKLHLFTIDITVPPLLCHLLSNAGLVACYCL